MNPYRNRHRRTTSCLFVATLLATAACAVPGSDQEGFGLRRTTAPPTSAPPSNAAPGPADATGSPADGEVAPQPAPGESSDAFAKPRPGEQAVEAAQARQKAAAKWGLTAAPLIAPPPPETKPRLTDDRPQVIADPGVPPVLRRVPTTDKVVFLTVDDGAEKDPAFSRMLRELDIPVSVFVSDYLIPDYGYFRDLAEQGVAVHNHTLNHPDLRKLGRAAQEREICGQQDNLAEEIGVRPRLFRPPYGEYTPETLRVAASCGITAVPMWNQEVFVDRIDYRYTDHRFHPGDIILTHFRGPTEW
ncbi:MAG TPA: polysaccharide deacetylase family protein, partial [Yinghuangia sp.]|nr:polysaccharide deacetylase family protein [Yinghuangia sp.]